MAPTAPANFDWRKWNGEEITFGETDEELEERLAAEKATDDAFEAELEAAMQAEDDDNLPDTPSPSTPSTSHSDARETSLTSQEERANDSLQQDSNSPPSARPSGCSETSSRKRKRTPNNDDEATSRPLHRHKQQKRGRAAPTLPTDLDIDHDNRFYKRGTLSLDTHKRSGYLNWYKPIEGHAHRYLQTAKLWGDVRIAVEDITRVERDDRLVWTGLVYTKGQEDRPYRFQFEPNMALGRLKDKNDPNRVWEKLKEAVEAGRTEEHPICISDEEDVSMLPTGPPTIQRQMMGREVIIIDDSDDEEVEE